MRRFSFVWRGRAGPDPRQLPDAGVYRNTIHLEIAGSAESINFSDISLFFWKSEHNVVMLYMEKSAMHDKLRSSNLWGFIEGKG